MTVIGVDIGYRKIAVAVPSEKFVSHISMKNRPGVTRTQEVAELVDFLNLIPYIDGADVFLEAPVVAGARNIQSTIKVSQTSGIIWGAIAGRAREIQEVAVSSWKLGTLGRGNATKDEVAQWVDDNHKTMARLCSRNQDLYDATCIALYGETLGEH